MTNERSSMRPNTINFSAGLLEINLLSIPHPITCNQHPDAFHVAPQPRNVQRKIPTISQLKCLVKFLELLIFPTCSALLSKLSPSPQLLCTPLQHGSEFHAQRPLSLSALTRTCRFRFFRAVCLLASRIINPGMFPTNHVHTVQGGQSKYRKFKTPSKFNASSS